MQSPVSTAYYVGKRRPASELRYWQILLIRLCYLGTGWASDYSVEAVGIYTDREEALKAASIPGGFMHELPINASLPDVPCNFSEHVFPLSPQIHKDRCEMVAVPRCNLDQLRSKVNELSVRI